MKFYINKKYPILLYKLLKEVGVIADFSVIRTEIKNGRVSVNGESVNQQRYKVNVGDEVKYRNFHIRVLSFEDKNKLEQEATGNVLHGKVPSWELKLSKRGERIDGEIKKMVKILHKKMLKNKLSIAFAESCTGGMLQEIVSSNSGASQYFRGGVVAYSEKVKIHVLKVPYYTINKYGVVSRETAFKMMEGLSKLIFCDIAVSVTGIAGPDGGTREKPVGTVYVAIGFNKKVAQLKFNFKGNREEIRKKASLTVILKLIDLIEEIEK